MEFWQSKNWSLSSIKYIIIDHYKVLLLFAVITYIIAWSTIDILRMLNMMDGVFDSGIISLTLNSILFDHTPQYMEYMIGFSLLRILFSPLILIDGIPGMLVFQEIFLGIPAFVIYGIAKIKTKDNLTSFLISTSYLLYFPLAGINYFDYHFQSFFIFFFLLAYYLFLKERYALSSISFFLSGSVRFPYFGFPYLFFLMLIIYEIIKNRNKININSKKIRFLEVNFIIFLLMIIISAILLFKSPYYLDQKKYFFGYFHLSSSSLMKTLLSNINNKVINLLLLLTPLLFIPLRSPKWLIFLSPFIIFSLFNNYGVYTYPSLYHDQYTAAVVPFLYLGLIEGIRIYPNDSSGKERNKKKQCKLDIAVALKKTTPYLKERKEPISLFLVVVLFAVLFQPYSPVNPYTTEPFDMDIMHPNMNVYNAYIETTNLIPENNPYVIYQNNLPYVDVHDRALSCLEAFDTVYGYPTNLTYLLQNLTMTNKIDYALAYYGTTAIPLNMLNAMNTLYSKGKYGIESSEYGFVLLARNYKNAPIYFKAIEDNYNLKVINYQNSSILEIPFNLLVPSSYNLNINLNTSTVQLETYKVEIISSGQKSYDYNLSPATHNGGGLNLLFNINRFYENGYLQVYMTKNLTNEMANVTLSEQKL